MDRKQSEFIEEDITDADQIGFFRSGANRRTTWLKIKNSFLDFLAVNFLIGSPSSVAALAAMSPPLNAAIMTKGCIVAGDGGHGDFIVESATGTPDGFSRVLLANGYHGVLQPVNGGYCELQFGVDLSASSAGLNRAFTFVNSIGGGVVYGTSTVKNIDAVVTLRTGVVYVGTGRTSCVLQRAAGYNGDMFKTLNFDALVNTESPAGPNRFGFRGVEIDGRKEAVPTATGWCLRIYGRTYTLDDVYIHSCPAGGWYSRWATSAAAYDDDNTDAFMEATIYNLHISECKTAPVFDGPHDSQIGSVIIALSNHNQPPASGTSNFVIGSRAGGTQFNSLHVWGDQAEWSLTNYASYISIFDLVLDDARVNGGMIKQLGSNCYIAGRGLQFGTDNIKGLQIGDGTTQVTGNNISLHLSRCELGAVDFANDGGNYISIVCEAAESTVREIGTRSARTRFFYLETGAALTNQNSIADFAGASIHNQTLRLRNLSATPTLDTWQNGMHYYDTALHCAREYRNGGWQNIAVELSGPTGSRPSLPSGRAGAQYFDTTLNKPIFWNGSQWRDASSNVV